MSRNIEIKASYPNLEEATERLKKLPVQFEGVDEQTDIFYRVNSGRLKLRRSKLYGDLLIPYLREDQQQPKSSEYVLIAVSDADQIEKLLSQILGVDKKVHKFRAIYHFQNVRIHLDQVDGLGTYIELEAVVRNENDTGASRERINFLMKQLHICPENLIAKAYVDLLP